MTMKTIGCVPVVWRAIAPRNEARGCLQRQLRSSARPYFGKTRCKANRLCPSSALTQSVGAQYQPFVMPGLDPGIHATVTGGAVRRKDVDGRVEPGHDDDMNRPFVSKH
jgi:hypothetical protein